MKTLKLAPEWPVLVHRLKSFAYLTDPSQYLAICSSPRVALRSGRFCIHMLVEHIRIRTVRAGSFVFATSTAGCEQTLACALTRTTQSGLIRSSWKTRRCLQMYAFENCIDWVRCFPLDLLQIRCVSTYVALPYYSHRLKHPAGSLSP